MGVAMAMGGDARAGVYCIHMAARPPLLCQTDPTRLFIFRPPIPRSQSQLSVPPLPLPIPAAQPLQQQLSQTPASTRQSHPPAFHSPISILAGSPLLLAALRFAPYVLSSSLPITSPAPACSSSPPDTVQAPCHAKSYITKAPPSVFIVASSTHSSTPPLHYHSGRESSAESSPVSTPNSSRHHSVAHPRPQQQFYQVASAGFQSDDKAQDLFSQFTTADEFDSDDILFPADDADSRAVALFPDATQTSTYPTSHSCAPNDIMPSPPIQIATPRQASNSPPRNQQSNLTSQLRQPQASDDLEMDGIPNSNDFKPRQESVSMLSTTPYGARAIPVSDGMGFRRESHVGLSGSLMGGMSWGGLSMGSFVRDE
jgi:hypothetical protein